MKIAIAADHGGFELKAKIIKELYQQGIYLEDLGTNSEEAVDYPDIASVMAHRILDKKADLGILICGTGVGISVAANRYRGIRAAILYDKFVAKAAKEHNNANIAVFGGRTQTLEEVMEYLNIFLKAKYEGGRHDRRIGKMDV